MVRRTAAVSLAATAVLGIGLAACGSDSATPAPPRTQVAPSTGTSARHASRPAIRPSVTIRPSVKITKVGDLPAAVQDAAAVPLSGGRVVLLGGIDAAGTSASAITVLDAGHAVSGGTLPTPQHDAQAARLGSDVFVFGGGEFSSFDHILRYDPTSHRVSAAGTLPTPASDVGVAALGQTAYIVGGFDGSRWLDSILAWRPAAAPRLAARLPFGLRYASVAAVDGRLLIIGGITPSRLSNTIFSFHPVTGKVTRIGRLPVPLTHSSAAEFEGRVLVIGGRRSESGAQTSAILEIDPVSGAVRRIGRLPRPLSDAAVVASGKTLIVAGGETAGGAQRTILSLTPHLPQTPSGT